MLTSALHALAVSTDVPTDIIGGVGVLALIVGGLVVVFGERSKLVAEQQSQSIDALEGRVTALESENRALRDASAEKDAQIIALRQQVSVLEKIVTSKAQIEQLGQQLEKSHTAIIDAIRRLEPPRALPAGSPL